MSQPSGESRLRRTLKAWPVITAATIGLCFLTQQTARLFGIDLPDQQNVEVVRKYLVCAFKSWGNFANASLLVAEVLLIMPAIEECLFRGLLFKLPTRLSARARFLTYGAAILSSALFSAAHYIMQPWPDAAFVALFFFGLAQCWLYRRTERLWCPMLNHALFNLTNLVLLFTVPQA